MINREDILELTRRMTLPHTSFTRIVECYVDRDGDLDEGFNISLLELSASEWTKKLKLAKEIPFAATDVNLKKYEYTQSTWKPGNMQQPLIAVNKCGLKSGILADVFYDVVMEHYCADGECAIPVFHGRYDIPAEGPNRKCQWESEKVFEYMIYAVCPLSGKYEPGKPIRGFLFPASTGRSEDLNHIDAFQADADRPHNGTLKLLGIN